MHLNEWDGPFLGVNNVGDTVTLLLPSLARQSSSYLRACTVHPNISSANVAFPQIRRGTVVPECGNDASTF